MSDPTAAAPAAPAALVAAPVAAPVAATPAAAPIPAPLNVEPVAAPLTPAPAEDLVVEYNPTGDASLDLALRFVGQLGFGPDRPEIQAAQQGDFEPLAASLEKLGDKAKGYKSYLKVAKESYTRNSTAHKAKEDAAQAAVISAVGGTDSWNAIHAWVVAEASDEQKASINAAFKGGEYSAVAMARQLADLYKQTGQDKSKPKSVVSEAAAGGAPEAGAITGQQFKDEMKKLVAKYGSRLESKPEYEALAARRRAGLASKI